MYMTMERWKAEESGQTKRIMEFKRYIQEQWGNEDPSVVVDQIGEGHYYPTQAFLTTASAGTNNDYRTQLVHAGAIDRILEFLLQSNQPFSKVLQPSSTKTVECPSLWLQVIGCVCREGFLSDKELQKRIQNRVVNHIQGVFQDISNFEERTFFGKKDSWIRSLLYFTALLRNLLTTGHNATNNRPPPIAKFLLKQAPLRQFLVRVIYMELGGIPPQALQDIQDFERHNMEIIGFCQSYAAFAIKVVTGDPSLAEILDDPNPHREASTQKVTKKDFEHAAIGSLLKEFAITPISPGHDWMFGSAMVKLLESSKGDGWYRGGYTATLVLFKKLYDYSGRLSGKFLIEDCVSSNLVSVARDYLVAYASKKKDAEFLENIVTGLFVLSGSLLTPMDDQMRQAPIDYNVAHAIYSGLMEYCCDICDACNDNRFVKPLTKVLQIIAATARFPLTQKALISKQAEIQAKIERVEERPPFLFSCLPAIQSILNTVTPKDQNEKPPACEFCGEKCGKSNPNTKKCPFCRSVEYCSSDCLQLNHLLHQKSCVLLRKYPPPKASSASIVREGKALFAAHFQKLLLQASLKGFSILYCIIVIDMAEATPLFRTLTIDQFHKSYKIPDEDVLEQAKASFDQNQTNGGLTVSMIGFTNEGLSISFLTFPPDSAPTHFGPKVSMAMDVEKWTVAQRHVAQSFFPRSEDIPKLQGNPKLWQASILKTMKP